MDFDKHTVQVSMLLLSIARKSIKSSIERVNVEDLRPPQAMFLIGLLETGSVTMSEIAAETRVHPTVVTRFMDRMVDKGFVERRHDEDDRRVVRVSLTERGKETAEKLLQNYLDRVDAALKGASKKERDSLIAQLNRIDGSLSE